MQVSEESKNIQTISFFGWAINDMIKPYFKKHSKGFNPESKRGAHVKALTALRRPLVRFMSTEELEKLPRH